MCLSPSILFYFHLPSVLFSWIQDRDRLCPLHPRVPQCPAQKAAPVPWCLCPRASLLNHPLFTATGEEKQSLAEAPPDGIFICGIAGEGDGCWNPPFLVLVPSPLPEHHGWGRQRGDRSAGLSHPSGSGSVLAALGAAAGEAGGRHRHSRVIFLLRQRSSARGWGDLKEVAGSRRAGERSRLAPQWCLISSGFTEGGGDIQELCRAASVASSLLAVPGDLLLQVLW